MERMCKLAFALLLITFCFATQIPSPALARVDSRNVISGELVAIDGTRNQFRIVGHGGTFTAPAGFSVHALDGKPVYVELAGGRVVQISEMPIPIKPVEHGFETVTGELVVRDAATGSFMIAGDGRIYAAPPDVDIRQYAGRRVELRLDEQGRLIDLHLATASDGAPLAPLASTCAYNGQAYSEGISVCQSGTQYRCGAGTWRTVGACTPLSPLPCAAGGTSYADGATRCEGGTQFLCERGQWRSVGAVCPSEGVSALRSPPTCVVGGATVADGSSICREGTAYRCSYGQWVNLGTACS